MGVGPAFRRFYPDYLGEGALFSRSVELCLAPQASVLDAGCGNGTVYRYRWKDSVRVLAGCDISPSIARNTNLSAAARGDLRALPFTAESFDVIFCRYVLEHLETPQTVFDEFARLLKPGGSLIVLTPSKYHYVAAVGRWTPHWFHESVGRVRGNTHEDTFPTRYLANSRGELERLGQNAGFKLRNYLAREVCPNYLLWSLPSFLAGVAYERTVNRVAWLSPLRVSIIAAYEK
jgi:SAM-dependent methyltransferase